MCVCVQVYVVCVCVCVFVGGRRVLGIEWRLSMGTCIWLLECLYTAVPSPPHTQRVLVNVQAARRYRIYSEAVDYTGRGRSPRRGIVNSRGGYPVRAETPDVN